MEKVTLDNAKPMSPSEIANHLLAFAEFHLRMQGDVDPMIVGLHPSGRQIAIGFKTKPTDSELAKVKAELKFFGATSYATLMESWFTTSEDGADPTVMPSKSDRRREAICVSVCDDTGVLAFELREIERDCEGKPSLSSDPLKSFNKDEKPTYGGRFAELLMDD